MKTNQPNHKTDTASGNSQPTPVNIPPNNINRFESNKKYFTISIYTLIVIIVSTIFIYMIINANETRAAFTNLLKVLFPFIVAFFISYLLNPFVRVLESDFYKNICKIKHETLRKILSILTAYIVVIGIITIALRYIFPEIVESITDLTDQLPIMYNEIILYLGNLEQHYPNFDFKLIEEKLKESLPQLIGFGTNLVTNIIPLLYTLSLSIVKLFINILLSIVISCYMLSDKAMLSMNAIRFTYAILPKKKAESFCQTCKECNNIFSGFVIGKSIDSLIIGILCFLIMSLLHLPYSILLSVIVGITNMIPYFGPFIGAIPGIIIYIFINPVHAIVFSIMIFLLQQFDGLILGPKILGDSTGLKPLWVIFGITVGGAYGGVLGMFLGVPLVAVVAHLLNKFIVTRLKNKNITIDS